MFIPNKIQDNRGLEFAVNHPPATLFDQFLKERTYLKNVSPQTIIWYQVAFKNFRATLNATDPPLPTKATLQRFVIHERERQPSEGVDPEPAGLSAPTTDCANGTWPGLFSFN